MTATNAPRYQDIRDAMRDLCRQYPDEYHRKVDEARAYPEAFVDALTEAGWLAALIPRGIRRLRAWALTEASVIMEEINRSGGNSGACHGADVHHGHAAPTRLARSRSSATCRRSRPASFGCNRWRVTEPTTGTDTTKIKTTAVRNGDRYVVNGQKVWISRVQHSDLMILLARTTPLAEVKKKSEGLSVFLVDLREAIGNGLAVRPIRNMVNHETNELFFDDLEIPGGEPDRRGGPGLPLHPGRPERRAHADRRRVHRRRLLVHRQARRSYAKERIVFDRPIGQNQGVQFPIARPTSTCEAADLMRFKAAELFDADQPCGARGEHGQAARGRRVVGGRQRLPADPRRLRLRGRVRRRAQVPRDAPVPGGADLDQPDPRFVAEHVLGLPRRSDRIARLKGEAKRTRSVESAAWRTP